MKRFVLLTVFVSSLSLICGCEQLEELLGSGDEEPASEPSDSAGNTPAEPQPRAGQPQEGQGATTSQPQTGAVQPEAGGQPQAATPTVADGGNTACERAARCCNIASNIQNFPEMAEQQREQACRAVHQNTNLNEDGCNTTMGIIRQLYRFSNQQIPAECNE